MNQHNEHREIQFRPCQPDDVDKAIPLIFSSGPDAFNYVFTNDKVTAQDFLSYAFQKKGGEFSYDNHIALLYNDELIGVGSVFSDKKANSFTFTDARKILKFYKLSSIPILIHGLQIEKIIRLPKINEICLAHIGIDKEYRGRGFGQQLLKELMIRAQRKSNQYFILDVSEENPRAKQLYDRLGFNVSKRILSNHQNQHGRIHNHLRMELRL